MKKLILGLCFLVSTAAVVSADWIEPYIVGCRNNLYMNNSMVYGKLEVSTPIVNFCQTWTDVPTASSVAYANIYISTITLKGGGTTWTPAMGSITQITSVGRDVSAQLFYQVGNSTITTRAILTIVGLDCKGKSITEYMVVCSTEVLYSSNAFLRITSFNIAMSYSSESSAKSQTSVEVHIGHGIKMGLNNDINVVADVYKVIEDGADVAVALTTRNSTYDTIQFAAAPDGSKDYTVYYSGKTR